MNWKISFFQTFSVFKYKFIEIKSNIKACLLFLTTYTCNHVYHHIWIFLNMGKNPLNCTIEMER